MAHRTIRISQTLALFVAAYVVLAGAQLYLSAPLQLAGFILNPDLTIVPGSTLPSSDVQPGDRIVAADRQAVGSARELAAALTRSRDPQVNVVIEQRGRLRTVTLSALRYEQDPPEDLLEAHRLVRVDGQRFQGDVPPAEVATFIEAAAPTPIEVEYEARRARVEGPAAVQAQPPDALVLGWLALGVVALLGLSLSALQRFGPAGRVDVGVGAVGAGALANAAVTAVLASEGTSPLFALWAISAVAVWRALVAAGAEESGARRPVSASVAGLVAVGAAFATVSAAGQPTVAGWLQQILQVFAAGSAVCLATLCAEAVSARDAPERALRWAAVVAGSGAGVAAFALGASDTADAFAAGWVVASALTWSADVRGLVARLPVSGRRVDGDQDLGLARALGVLGPVVGDAHAVSIYAGVDGDFVRIQLIGDDAADARVFWRVGEAETAAFLAMLATEGGMFPRPQLYHGRDVVEDDPFALVRERLGVAAAVPVLAAEGAQVTVFAVVERSDDGASAPPDIGAFLDAVDRTLGPLGRAEAAAICASAFIGRVRAARAPVADAGDVPARAPAERGIASSSGAVAPVRLASPAPMSVGPVTARLTPPSSPVAGLGAAPRSGIGRPMSPGGRHPEQGVGLDAAWTEHLAESLEIRYPVHERDALDDREWLALSFLRDSVQPALIVGEPGVGKEFVARAVHAAMWGRARRFVVLDCAVRPPSVVEAELFGDEGEVGLVALVGDGTLMLKQASTLGDGRLEALVPRLVAAPCRMIFAERYRGEESGTPASIPGPLRAAVEERSIHLSPLRERPDDIVRYAAHFLHRAAMRYGLAVTDLHDDAEAHLTGLDLRGNLVELEALVISAALRSEGRALRRADFGVASEAPAQAALELSADEEVEKRRIVEALTATGQNRSRAAALLGISRGKLIRRLDRFGLDR